MNTRCDTPEQAGDIMKPMHSANDRGFATLIALIMVGMLTLIGLAAMSTSDDEVAITGNQLQEMRSFYAAEAGLESVAATLQHIYDSTEAPPVDLPSGSYTVNECEVSFATSDMGPAQQRVLSEGTLSGLNALVKSFNINAVAISPLEQGKMSMSQTFETATIPIFQFAVFYGNDLEIAPGPDMTLFGRVHSNGNLWVQAGSTLRMDSYVTASGDIQHGRKGPGGLSTGDVQIKDASGTYQTMRVSGSDFLDSRDSNWYSESINRWDGRVKDASHGQGELELPLTNESDDAHKMIEPYDGGANPDSYEQKATLKIINGQALQKIGSTWVDVTADMTSLGVITWAPDKFTDGREGKTVDVMEFDVAKMYDEGFAPDNGVMYFADEVSGAGDYPALRLLNGSSLDDGLSVVSANPVYTLGDFNSVDKKPAAIMGDAVTFLSNSWDDANSALSKSSRVASNTTVNASYLTGNVNTTETNYSGGFENLPRFLEKWSSKTFTWKGSAVNLWNSTQATGLWNGNYYDPPTRNWSYDTDLDDPNNLPPGTPSVRVFQRTGWRQEFVGFSEEAAGDLSEELRAN